MSIKIVTKTVSADSWSNVGHLISHLCTGENSPRLVLNDMVLCSSLVPAGTNSFYLSGISPEDLDYFKALILEMELPIAIRQIAKDEDWDKAKRYIIDQLVPQTL